MFENRKSNRQFRDPVNFLKESGIIEFVAML